MVSTGLSNSGSNCPQIACHLIQESFHMHNLTNKYLHGIIIIVQQANMESKEIFLKGSLNPEWCRILECESHLPTLPNSQMDMNITREMYAFSGRFSALHYEHIC